MLRFLTPYVLLTLLCLLFFQDLVCHPGWVLYSDHSDLLAEHVPAKRFLVRSFQETGELPLWCPYHFAGAPFLHDIQVAVFYPPHALLLLLDERHIGTAVSWLLVGHVLLAGWLMHLYAKEQGLGRYGSFVAATGYMFAGKWLLHLLEAGHYVLIGLAWLPLVLLCLERAIRRGSLAWATAAGIVFALLTIGTHPQWTFYAGLLVVPWTFRKESIFRWLGLGAWAALLALGLCAVQLLPTAEAASLSMRSLEMPQQDFRTELAKTLTMLIGPDLIGSRWENRSGFSVPWLAVAVAAPLLCKGRVRFQAAVLLGLFLFALGGVWLQSLPIFRSFRTPARMLVLAALPLAMLAGAATQALFETPPPSLGRRRVCFLVMFALSMLAVTLGFREVGSWSALLNPKGMMPYWRVLLLTLPALFFALLRQWRAGTPSSKLNSLVVLWVLALLADLWAMNWPLVQARADDDLFAPSACVRYLIEQRKAYDNARWRVVDQGAPEEPDMCALGTGYVLSPIHRIEGLGGYNPLDVLRTRQFYQFIDGSEEAVRPLEGALGLPAIAAFSLNEKNLLDLLGVRYVLRTKQGPWPPLPGEEGDWRVVAADEHPRAYNFARGELRDLPPYEVLENQTVLPRAFVVPGAGWLKQSEVLAELRNTDFKRLVLLEECQEKWLYRGYKGNRFQEAAVKEYRPNLVRLEVAGHLGTLVLTDVWYPGWKCKVDGIEVPMCRANYLFRAVQVEGSGNHEVVFTFEPRSYLIGRIVSGFTMTVAVVVFGFTWLKRRHGSGTSLKENVNGTSTSAAGVR